MTKPVLIAGGGLLAGALVALGLFVFVFRGDGASAAEESPPEPVSVAGKVGPHILLADRVFNLRSPSLTPAYLKLQTLVEFETTDERWARVLNGCVAAFEARPSGVLVSAHAGGRPAVTPGAMPAADAGGGDPCGAEEARLLDEFDREIGTGRQLMEDAVTSVVAAYTADELSTPEGKEALRVEIRDAIDGLMGERHAVTRVLFLNFITQ